MVGWHHQLNGHEFEQTVGDSRKDREAWHAAAHGVSKTWTRLTEQQKYIYTHMTESLWCTMETTFHFKKS